MLSFRRSFLASAEALAPGHPYTLDASNRVPFVEYRGAGPPHATIGQPGDVYIQTGNAYTLYWRDRDGRDPQPWHKWTSLLLDQVPLYRYLVAHPWADDAQSSDIYLWADPTGVSWTSRAEICSSRVLMIQEGVAIINPGDRNPDVAALVSEILVKMIDAEDRRTLPPILEREPPPIGRARSQSSATPYSRPPPTALPQHHSRPPSPHAGFPSKRRNTITGSSNSVEDGRRLPPLPLPSHTPLHLSRHNGSPRMPHSNTNTPPSAYRPSPYDRDRPPRSPPSTSATSPRPTPSSHPGPDLRNPHPQEHHQYRREPPSTSLYAYGPVVSAAGETAGAPLPLVPARRRRHEQDGDEDHHHDYERLTPPPPPTPPATVNVDEHPPPAQGDNFAWTEMQRAQYAEAHFKRELRQKNRELAKFKKKEKDIISLSFLYQKKEQELMEALTNAEKRAQEELEKQREAVRAAQRHVEDAQTQTRDAVSELQRLEDALSDARDEIQRLKSYAERIEEENEGLKDEMSRFSSSTRAEQQRSTSRVGS